MIPSYRATFAAASLVLATAIAAAGPVRAQMPGCTGKDIMAELKAAEPDVYAEIRKAADATEFAKTAFWKIEHPDHPDRTPSYLFATVHLTDDRLHKLPAVVEEAFISTRKFAIEVEDTSPGRVSEGFNAISNKGALWLAGSARLDGLLTKAEFQLAAPALGKTGLPPAMQTRVQPWVATMMAATSDCEKSRMLGGKLPLDGELSRRAENFGVGTMGLESIEAQLLSMASVPHDDQLALLKSHLSIASRANDMTETLVQLYLARDFGAIMPLQRALAKKAGVDPKAFAAFDEHVVQARVKRMLDRAYMHIESRGGVFMAVGATQVIGKHGLVAKLKEMGYTVTAVE